MDAEIKLKCLACGHIFTGEDALESTSPFDEDDTIIGCPSCKAAEEIAVACDYEGCSHESTWGGVTPNGYTHGWLQHRKQDFFP